MDLHSAILLVDKVKPETKKSRSPVLRPCTLHLSAPPQLSSLQTPISHLFLPIPFLLNPFCNDAGGRQPLPYPLLLSELHKPWEQHGAAALPGVIWEGNGCELLEEAGGDARPGAA